MIVREKWNSELGRAQLGWCAGGRPPRPSFIRRRRRIESRKAPSHGEANVGRR